MKKITTLVILLFSFHLFSQNDRFQKIDSIISSKIGEKDPALFVGVVQNGKIVYKKYHGVSNLQHQVKANEKTVSNIASVAKQFTALMILDLDLNGKLNVEDDIRKYLPQLYPSIKEKIRIRHLINHTSGIRDYSDLLSIQGNPWWRQVGMDNDDVIQLIEEQEDLGFTPGSMKIYSNTGYTILTKIIETVTGKSFHEYSREFFQELGMNNTFFAKNYMAVIPNHARPYSDWGDGVWKEYPMLTNLYGDGFLFTTLEDQLIYEQAVQNAKFNNNILLIKSQEQIPNSEIKTYGFGLELENRLNRKAVHHSGATGSYHAQTTRYPNEQLSVFVMSSNSRIWSGFIADEVASVFLPKKKKNVNYDKRIRENSDISQKSDVIGQYRSPRGYLIRIEETDEKLYWKNANNRPIEIAEQNTALYKVQNNPDVKIKFYKNELIRFYPDGSTSVYKRELHKTPTLSDLESYTGEYYSSELDVSFSIQLAEDNKLIISRDDWKNNRELQVLNRNELLVSDYILKIQRDAFDRVTDILLTTNRVLNSRFQKKTNLKFHPKTETENGSIQVTTIGSRKKDGTQILLTKNDQKGNEIWYKKFGGTGYDKASSILVTQDGYLIIGSTSSYGNGNYDMYVIKTDKDGKKLWQNTYGKFNNDYGYSAEKVENGFIIKGTIQRCNSRDVLNRKCTTNVWFVTIDEQGNQLSDTILEEIND